MNASSTQCQYYNDRYLTLKEQIKLLHDLNQRMAQEANNLTRALFVVVVPFLFFSCKEEVAQTDCPPTIGCTEVFVSVTLEVVDTDGEPVALDDYYTFIDSKNEFKIDNN